MKRIPFPDSLRWLLVPAILFLFLPQAASSGQTWQVTLGAQSKDAGKQAMAFLPNELWISAGDNITWTTQTGEAHTVTFLKQTPTGASTAGTTRPANGTAATMGCNGGGQGGASAVTPSGSSFDATACVNSGPICDPTLQQIPEPSLCFGWTASTVETQYSVTFPTAGNFKLVCLIHRDMTGVVHVVPLSASLPHNQFFYDDEAADQTRNIISDRDHPGRDNDDQGDSSRHVVVTTGELVATGGGKMHLAIMRFLPSTIHVDVGDTVEWTNVDPSVPHTVTFGVEPAIPTTLLGVSDADADGDREGSIPNSLTSPSPCTIALPCVNTFNPGTIGAALQDQGPTPPTGPVPQTPLGVTRARVTFTHAGTYNYFCALHDELGMVGKVIVGDSEEDDDPR